MRYKKIVGVFIMLFSCLTLLRAEVLLEEVIQAGRFVFYRDHADPSKYYYVPDEPRLATKKDGTPEFTFIKYTKTGGDIKGGIVHFLVTWGLTESEIFSAETSLQMIDPEAKVVGPVPFKEGTFQIISATAGEGGLFNVKICGEGKAPIMPGQKGAVSIALTQEGASLLWESFKNPTSDISVMFMLKYDGITPAYEAKLKVDWDKVYTHQDVSVSGGGTIKALKLEGEIKAIFDELRQKGAIQLEVTGESQEMEKLLEVTYGHLIKLMCNTEIRTDDQISKSKSTTTRRPTRIIKREGENGEEASPVLSRSWNSLSLGSLAGQLNPLQRSRTLFAGLGSPWAFGDISSGQDQQRADAGNQKAEALKQEGKSQTSSSKTQSQTQTRTQRKPARKTSTTKPTVSKKKPEVKPPFNLKVAYTFKRVKMSGHYEVDLRHRIREERVMVMSGNIGGVYQQFGEDKRFFSTVSLDDPVFQERTIEVILDGQDFEDFKDYINNVSVLFKKERWGKPATTGEVKFFDEQFAEKGNRLTFIYGREGEGSTEWLNYEYKPKWSFHGGIEWEGDWMKTSDSVVTLSPVVEYRTVQISMDKDNIEENGIKAAAFQIKHQIFGKDVLREVIIDYERGDPLQAEYRYLHEEGKLGYQYKIIWLLRDGREIHSDWMTKETPIIYAFYQE